jgi:hypothetical protein
MVSYDTDQHNGSIGEKYERNCCGNSFYHAYKKLKDFMLLTLRFCNGKLEE